MFYCCGPGTCCAGITATGYTICEIDAVMLQIIIADGSAAVATAGNNIDDKQYGQTYLPLSATVPLDMNNLATAL